MSRRPARFSEIEWRLIVSAVKEAGVTVDILPDDTVRVYPLGVLPSDGQARHAGGYVEERLADAPWGKK